MCARGDLRAIGGVPDVYLVTTRYADVIPVSDELIIQEANPTAVFSHLTALAYHHLTDIAPREIYATHYTHGEPTRRPLGTTPEDWVGVALPAGSTPRSTAGTPVIWTGHGGLASDFGDEVGFSHGLPIYVTDTERTLLDCLQEPMKAHGVATVLRAWLTASESWSLERLLRYVARVESPVLCQRVGFVLETLGVRHPTLDAWAAGSVRGGSMKLVADAPYAPIYSERWCLSLNVPAETLDELSYDN